MSNIDIKRVDLNLLKTFVALLKTGSVTAASEQLGTAQSSTSHALARLRTTFGDQLFVRAKSGMQPTLLAQRLAEPIVQSLDALQAALDAGVQFDPRSSRRVFRLLMTDIVEMLVLPPLMRKLQAMESPVELQVMQVPRSTYRDALEMGQADLALGQLPETHTDFMQQTLFDVGFMCAMRMDHPLAGGMTMADFFAARHVAIGSPAVGDRILRRALGAQAVHRTVALTVPHYLAAPFILANSDLVAVLPEPLCRSSARAGFIVGVPLPIDVPPAVFRQFWHERTHADPGCRWLRTFIADAVA